MTTPTTQTRDVMIDEYKREELVTTLHKVQRLIMLCEIDEDDNPLVIALDYIEDALRFLRKIRSTARE